MGAPGLARRLWEGVWHRHSLGRMVIKFYPPGAQASITAAPPLDALSRHEWHWVFLQHLAESLCAIEEQEAVRLLVAARALAEDFVSSSYWPRAIGEKFPNAVAGAAEIVPEHPGGVALAIEVFRHRNEMPTVRLEWSPPQARERLASSNLVLLVRVMNAATHPLEQYELFKKISLFADYCGRVPGWHNRATLRTAPLYAVVHADIAGIEAPARQPERKTVPLGVTGSDMIVHGARRASGSVPMVREKAAASAPAPPARRLWEWPNAAIAAAVLLWAGLVLGVFFAPRNGGGPPSPTPNVPGPSGAVSPLPSPLPDRVAIAPPGPESRRPASQALRTTRRAGRGSVDLPRVRKPVSVLEAEPGNLPRFRVVSGTLARGVAELRARTLADSGVDAFVRSIAGNLAQLQYGAYSSRMNAEAEAWHLRAEGYTAVIVPW
jgi:hypothetical protein